MDISKFNIEVGTHNGNSIIKIFFPYDDKLIREVKNLEGSKWSSTMKCWYVRDNTTYRKLFGLDAVVTIIDPSTSIHAVNQKAFLDLQQRIKLKGYSEHTLKTYTSEFAQFLSVLGNHSVETMSADRIRSYILYCIDELKLSENTIHSRLNALKFYYEQVLGRSKMFIEIPRPKKHLQLPKVLSTAEIKRLLQSTENKKHKYLLAIAYSMGLRVSEVVELKIADIDLDRNQVFIHKAKGKKDRYANLSILIKESYQAYIEEYKPREYLFEGQYGGQYSIRSAQEVFKQALKRAGIKKDLSFHSLRHSYATHLLEFGTDISLIKDLMGHSDVKTTLLYTHVTDKTIRTIKSPLDMI